MKNNIFVHLFVCVLLSVFFCSCEEEKASDNALNAPNKEVADTTNSNVNKDTIKQVEIKIENLHTQLFEVQSDFNKLKESVQEDKARNKWSVLIAWAISLISFIIAVVSLVKVSKLNSRLDRHRKEIEQLKGEISNLNFKPQQQVKSSQNSVSYSEFLNLANKVTNIEKSIKNNTASANNKDLIRSINVPKEDLKEISKNGYFGTAISGEGGSGYFRRLLDSNDDARFRAIVIGDSATYEPMVPLNAIKSSDAMDLAIEFEGVSKHDATSMSIKHKGKAQKMGDKWIIINKAVVTLN